MIFTRWWNSYRLMAPDNPAPKILDIIMEKLWDYQQGTVEQSDFVHFANCVVALLQKDMRTALEGKPMAELREIYQNEYLFSPEECARVTDDWL